MSAHHCRNGAERVEVWLDAPALDLLSMLESFYRDRLAIRPQRPSQSPTAKPRSLRSVIIRRALMELGDDLRPVLDAPQGDPALVTERMILAKYRRARHAR